MISMFFLFSWCFPFAPFSSNYFKNNSKIRKIARNWKILYINLIQLLQNKTKIHISPHYSWPFSDLFSYIFFFSKNSVLEKKKKYIYIYIRHMHCRLKRNVLCRNFLYCWRPLYLLSQSTKMARNDQIDEF